MSGSIDDFLIFDEDGELCGYTRMQYGAVKSVAAMYDLTVHDVQTEPKVVRGTPVHPGGVWVTIPDADRRYNILPKTHPDVVDRNE